MAKDDKKEDSGNEEAEVKNEKKESKSKSKKLTTKDRLNDIFRHTAELGGIFDYVRINTETKEGKIFIDASDSDRRVILNATLNDYDEELEGYFGFCNLPTISKLLKLSNYSGKGGTIALKRKGDIPTNIVFSDDDGNVDECTLMDRDGTDLSMQGPAKSFKGAEWAVEISPSVSKIEQLAEAAGIYSGFENKDFSVKTKGSDLIFEIGSSEDGVVGKRVFATDIDGELENVRKWDLGIFLKILRLGAKRECTVHFSDEKPVSQISFNSGIGTYNYIFPERVEE